MDRQSGGRAIDLEDRAYTLCKSSFLSIPQKRGLEEREKNTAKEAVVRQCRSLGGRLFLENYLTADAARLIIKSRA